ncbi:MAG: CotH kinase family protein [Tepidisphaerales bacterium]
MRILSDRNHPVILRPGLRVVLALVVLMHGSAPGQTTRPTTVKAVDLPAVVLETKGPITREPKTAFSATLVLPTEGNPAPPVPWNGTIRIRGATSQAYPKKSFSLALESPVQPPGMPSRSHWILNAAFIDRSLMRHKLAYDLFRSVSAPGQPRHAVASRFVEVHLNGGYQGVYLLMERVDRHLVGFAPFAKEDQAHACLFKAVNHDAGFDQPGHGGFVQSEPKPLVMAYWQPLDALNEFISTAPAAEFRKAETGIATRIDLDNAIDFHLLVLVTGNADGITKNFYLARARPDAGAPSPRFDFVPWDYDGTFGQNWNATPLPPELWLSNHLFDRLLEDPDYRRRFAARWQQLREKEFSVRTIQGMIDANAKELAGAARRNADRWAAAAGAYPDRVSFEQDVAQMKTWIAAHIAWLDQRIRRQR